MNSIFIECFGSIEDPRVDRTKKHLLLDILALGLCAVIAGAEGWEEIEDFGQDHFAWFNGFLGLPNGIPSHDTIARVFSALKPSEFQKACTNWLEQVRSLEPETVIAIDGKTLRGSSRKRSDLKGLHIVNAWSCANGISLGQLKVADKSNEITAVPELLKQLAIKGAIVTLDAMGCQEKIIADICDQEADYVVALKGNQGELHEAVQDSFTLADKGATTLAVKRAVEEIDAGHGRIDQRSIEVIDAAGLKGFVDPRWHKLNSLIRVTSRREEGGTTQSEQRYYISSLPSETPLKILRTIRQHWQVENCLHWSLDVSFNEDGCRVRDENAAINLSWMRKFALGLLRKDSSFKASIRRKQRKAAASTDYLARVIAEN